MTERSDSRLLLERELRKLAVRGVVRTFQAVGDDGPLDLPELFKIVEHRHRDKWTSTEQQKTDAIKETLRDASGDEALGEAILPGGRMTHRRIAEVMYDLFDTRALRREHRESKHISTTASILKAEANRRRDRHFDRFTNRTRKLLAKSLLRLGGPKNREPRRDSHMLAPRRQADTAPTSYVVGALMAALREGENRFDSPLRSALRSLTWDKGVLRSDLYDFLGSELSTLWHVDARDSSEAALIKVVWQLERLISQLSLEQHRLAARYSYNITGIQAVEWLQLGERQNALADCREHLRLSVDLIRDYMTYVILPLFESSIQTNPPPSPPAGIVVAVLERVNRGERVTAIMASLAAPLANTLPPPPHATEG